MKRFVKNFCWVCTNKKILLLLGIFFIIGLFVTSLNSSIYASSGDESGEDEDDDYFDYFANTAHVRRIITTTKHTTKIIKPKTLNSNDNKLKGMKRPKPSYNTHIFYYPWYGNPEFDKKYIHWNHKYLPHWSPEVAKIYPQGAHEPPEDIASKYYPALGAYSSRDPLVIQNHMQQLSFAGVGVLAVSYYPPGTADDNGEDWQSIFPILLDEADKYKLKVTFHIEPYPGRDEITVKGDIRYIIDTYSHFKAFYKFDYNGKTLPLIYVYDSYHTKPDAWSMLLKRTGKSFSIRGTKYDCFVIGLVVDEHHQDDMVAAGFDGFYTYFASNGFTYGSRRENWERLSRFAAKNNLIYIPSIGPGYIDTRVRPWNDGNTKKRLNGKYYKESWIKALGVRPKLISITSFNEWHEGTQIEEAIPKSIPGYKYADYLPDDANFYLRITKAYVQSFMELLKSDKPKKIGEVNAWV